ncbi:MAG: hypothetical protein ACJAXS_003083 [Colwellia sp.]|jgi:hypothetical protein
MRILILSLIFFVINANSTSLAQPRIAKNPECQIEIDQLDTQLTSAYHMMVPDIEINLYLSKLMELRELVILEGNDAIRQSIDLMITEQLLWTIKHEEMAKHFKGKLNEIISSTQLVPLLIEEQKQIELNQLLKSKGI